VSEFLDNEEEPRIIKYIQKHGLQEPSSAPEQPAAKQTYVARQKEVEEAVLGTHAYEDKRSELRDEERESKDQKDGEDETESEDEDFDPDAGSNENSNNSGYLSSEEEDD
jgi:hypothetical protein